MHRTHTKVMMSAAGLVLLFAPSVALAGHGKAGLWQINITMGGPAVAMPDMSKLPPEALARMKAMGIGMNGNTITVEHCRTPQEAAQDIPPAASQNKACSISNVNYAGGSMTADMTCTGKFSGTGHMHSVWDSDVHYIGEMTMSGTSGGRPFARSEKFEGHWLSAQCPAK